MTRDRDEASPADRRQKVGVAMAMLVALCVVLAMAGDAAATGNGPFSQLVVFGGPLEDIGNLASVVGDLPPPFFHNRFCNGPLAVETLARHLGSPLTPSLHRVGPARGNDFSSVDGTASGPNPQDLHGQIDAYFAMTDGHADPRALYYIIIGGLEVIAAAETPDDDAARAIIRGAVDAKERAIERLHAKGARTFLVPNFVEIGFSPQLRQAGLSERGDQMSQFHNRLMDRMLDRVDRRPGIRIIKHDWAHWVKEISNGAARLRFTNTTDSCLAKLPTGECDFDHFLFFNELFPTARVHELWGAALVQEVAKFGLHTRHDVEVAK
jgi:phospholipase/lecithinase/hemolysin